MFWSIISISVSPKNRISSFLIFNLSALNFICSADSSPETYKTFPSPLTLSHSCKIKVDFPIPGSPPTNTKEPLTNPPPNTLSSSAYPVEVLCASCPTKLFNGFGASWILFSLFPLSTFVESFSSKNVFHELQAGHFPIHFADS